MHSATRLNIDRHRIIRRPSTTDWGTDLVAYEIFHTMLLDQGVGVALEQLAAAAERRAETLFPRQSLVPAYRAIALMFETKDPVNVQTRHVYGVSGPVAISYIRYRGGPLIRTTPPFHQFIRYMSILDKFNTAMINRNPKE